MKNKIKSVNFKPGIVYILSFIVMFTMALILISFTLNKRVKKLEISDFEKIEQISDLKKEIKSQKEINKKLRDDINIILLDLYYEEKEEEMTYEDLFKNNN